MPHNILQRFRRHPALDAPCDECVAERVDCEFLNPCCLANSLDIIVHYGRFQNIPSWASEYRILSERLHHIYAREERHNKGRWDSC